MNIQEGNILSFEGKKYEVIKIQQEIDKYDMETEEFVGEHYFIELHEIGNKSLRPTHIAKRYFEKPEELIIFEIKKLKPLNLDKLKVGETLKYHPEETWINKKIVKIKDIEIQ